MRILRQRLTTNWLLLLNAFLFAILVFWSSGISALSGSIIADSESGDEVEIASKFYGSGTPVAHFYKARGTAASPTAAQLRDLLGGIGSRPYTGTTFTTHSTAAIHWIATENTSDTNQGTMIRFLVTPTGTTHTNRITAAEISPEGFLTHKAATAQAYKSNSAGNQTISNATYAAISFDAEEWDNDGIHSTSTNTTRFIAPVAGKYMVTATIGFASNSVGSRIINFRKNGNTTDRYGYQAAPALSGIQSQLTATHTFNLSANDYIEVYAWQDSGGNLAVVSEPATPSGITRMTMQYVGE